MNKEQLITILQSTLFSFEGASEKQILELNPDYNKQLIQIGIELNKFLELKLKWSNNLEQLNFIRKTYTC